MFPVSPATAWRNCGVSTHAVPGDTESSRSVSYEKKAKSLFLIIGPPMLPPIWLKRLSTRCTGEGEPGPFHGWYASRPGRSSLMNALPWKLLLPLCETTSTCAPLPRPYSASYELAVIRTSFTDSSLGVMIAAPPQSKLFTLTPSIWKLLPSLRWPFALIWTWFSVWKMLLVAPVPPG